MAALKKKEISIFGKPAADQGADGGVDAKSCLTSWLVAENAIFPKRGLIQKRPGTTRSAQAYQATQIESYGETAVLLGGGGIKRYLPSSDKAVDLSNAVPNTLTTSVSQFELGGCGNVGAELEVYDAGDFFVVAAGRGVFPQQTQDAVLRVYDKKSGSLLLERVGFVGTPRIVSFNGAMEVFFTLATGSIEHVTVDADGGGVTPRPLVPGASGYVDARCPNGFDVAVAGDYLYCVWLEATAVKINRMTTGRAWATAATVASGWTDAHCVGCWPVNDAYCAVGYSYELSGTNYLASRYYSEVTPVTTAVAVDDDGGAGKYYEGICGIDRNSHESGSYGSYLYTMLWTLAEDPTAGEPPSIKRALIYDNGGPGGTLTARPVADFMERARIAYAPTWVTQSSDDYLLGVYAREWNLGAPGTALSDIPGFRRRFDTLAWVTDKSDLKGAVMAAYALEGRARQGEADVGDRAYVAKPHRDSAGVSVGAVGVVTLAGTEGRPRDSEVRAAYVLTIELDARVALIETSGVASISGGCPLRLDGGTAAIEQSFLMPPTPLEVITSGASGPLEIGKTYLFVAIYRTVDLAGRVVRSGRTPVAFSYTPSVSSETKPVVYIPVFPLTMVARGAGGLFVDVYRTEGDGVDFYLESSEAIIDLLASVTTCGPRIADFNLIEKEELYTSRGILSAGPVPPHDISCIHDSRHCVVPSGERDTGRYSRRMVAYEGVAHNALLSYPISTKGGQMVAQRSLVGQIVSWRENAIYAHEGSLAEDDGSGQNLSTPHEVSLVVGCSNSRSLVRSGDGWMFEHGDRIYHLRGDMRPAPTGDRGHYWIKQYGPIVGAASLGDNRHVVVFALAGAGAPLLVYDWLYDRWATWSTPTDTLDVCAVGGVLCRLDVDGYVWVEDEAGTSFSDYDGTTRNYVALRLRTGFIHRDAADSGWARIWKVVTGGYKHSAGGSSLQLSAAYNGEPSFESKTFDLGGLTGFTSDDAYGAGSASYFGQALSLQFQPSSQKQQCSSIMVELKDVRSTDDDQQLSITSLALEVGLIGGLRRSGRDKNIVG